jgi:23S rRNA (adenine2503-C2)-methyltransferase
LAEVLGSAIDRPFRVEQIFRALHDGGCRDFSEMTNLSCNLRATLGGQFETGALEVTERHEAKDGTAKYLFELHDGATIEAVDIPDGGRRTYCISSQAGCALACRFCVTGYWGAGRDLTVSEIVGQVVGLSGGLDKLSSLNLVFMGMGEPLLNLGGLTDALACLTEWISWRRITVSTVGILPGLEAMIGWEKRPNLAISLHAPDDDRRTEIMPVNRRYPLSDLMTLLRRYPLERGRKITFEYILIKDFNDSLEDADALAQLVRGLSSKVNLIPVNSDRVLGSEMVPPSDVRIEAFCQRVRDRGVVTTIRQRRGDEVSAACGQLRAFGRDPRGFRRSNLSL